MSRLHLGSPLGVPTEENQEFGLPLVFFWKGGEGCNSGLSESTADHGHSNKDIISVQTLFDFKVSLT